MMDTKDHQLSAARYAFHKVRKKNYHDAIARGEMDEETARMMYAAAMANYDSIVRTAGPATMANEQDMARGFDG
jgi:hypothetical protein